MLLIFKEVFGSVFEAFRLTWWFVLPFLLFFALKDLWLLYVRVLFMRKIKWVTLEVRVPKDILQTPRAMEEVFSSMYATYSYGIKFWDKWWEGKIEKWISFEMVGMNGGIYFFIRTPADFRNLIESSIYGQFPGVEISETADYIEALPEVLPNKTYDLWGTEMEFLKPDPYPIKTHMKFEADIEERRIDPVGSLAETMSRLKEGEYILIQIMISPVGKPTGFDILGDGKKEIDGLIGGKKDEKKKGIIVSFVFGLAEFLKNLVLAVFKEPTWEGGAEEKKEEKKKSFMEITAGSQEMIKAIENKTSKLSFETTVRVIYIDRQDSFTPLNVSAVMGYFHQFYTQNLNAFKPMKKVITVYGGLPGKIFPKFKKYKLGIRKRDIYRKYRDRIFAKNNRITFEKRPILSTEELATLFHFPIINVEAPSMRRLPSKKGEPPVDLPIKKI